MNFGKLDLKATTECLMRSSLTPDQVTDLVHRYRTVHKGYRKWWVDWELLDAFKEVFSYQQYSGMIEQARLAAKDKTLTKMFCDWEKTNLNLEHYLDQSTDRPSFRWNVNYQVALTILERMINPIHLEPATLNSIEDAEKIWSNKSASAGAIGRGSKQQFAQECFHGAKIIERSIKARVPFDQIQIPATPAHRSQISSYVVDGKYSRDTLKEKDRLVWCVDGATVTFEGKFASVLIPYMINHWFSYSGGDSSVRLREKIHTCGRDKKYLSIDYSKFDQTVQSWLIRDCFSIIKKFFSPDYHKELDWICYNFIHTKIIMHGGQIHQKHRGIPSGSYFTQLIGSMCNALMMLTFLSSRERGSSFGEKSCYVETELYPYYVREKLYTMFVMGDDNLVFTTEEIDLDSLSKYVWRYFGVKINPDKCSSWRDSKYPEYLKREWRERGEYRDPLEMIINMVHPERERQYDGYSPWHIMYGIYLTFSQAFPDGLNERFFVEKMNDNGGIENLLSVNPKDLPGSLRAMGDNALFFLHRSAKALLSPKLS